MWFPPFSLWCARSKLCFSHTAFHNMIQFFSVLFSKCGMRLKKRGYYIFTPSCYYFCGKRKLESVRNMSGDWIHSGVNYLVVQLIKATEIEGDFGESWSLKVAKSYQKDLITFEIAGTLFKWWCSFEDKKTWLCSGSLIR